MPSQIGMPIKVVLADDSDIMREAIRRLLKEESRIEIVAEASTFAAAMQMVADFKPSVLLLDLHMPQKRNLPADVVKSQLNCIEYTLAISFSNDREAKALAESYGAVSLLDKMYLYSELIPAILQLSGSRPDHSYQANLEGKREVSPLELQD